MADRVRTTVICHLGLLPRLCQLGDEPDNARREALLNLTRHDSRGVVHRSKYVYTHVDPGILPRHLLYDL